MYSNKVNELDGAKESLLTYQKVCRLHRISNWCGSSRTNARSIRFYLYIINR